MKGSHSAPLIISVSTSSRFFGFSLIKVGNPAPPKPTSPDLRIAAIKSSRLSTTGGLTDSSTVCCPSHAMTIVCVRTPLELMKSSMAVTVPDTLEWIGTLINASESASNWPTLTSSLTFTVGVHGVPICCKSGIVTLAGTGMDTVSQFIVFL